MVYLYVLLFFVWNMCMASILTIPLYKVVCNLSYLDPSYLNSALSKEYLLYSFIDAVFSFLFEAFSNGRMIFVHCDSQNHIVNVQMNIL
jgi:hypothetical protein